MSLLETVMCCLECHWQLTYSDIWAFGCVGLIAGVVFVNSQDKTEASVCVPSHCQYLNTSTIFTDCKPFACGCCTINRPYPPTVLSLDTRASFKCWYSSVCRRIRQSQRNCFCLSVAPSQLFLSWGPCHAARVTFSCCMTQRFASLMADKAQDFYVGDQSLHHERLRSLDDFQSRNNDGLLNTSVSLQICSVTTSQINKKKIQI